MQSLTLTVEHKAKLLEMVKYYFPEYKHIHFDPCYNSVDGFDGLKMFWIHWFEFCMTYLPVRMFHKANERGGNNLPIITNNLLRFEDFGRYEINPIDYLYEQFKKLNTNVNIKS